MSAVSEPRVIVWPADETGCGLYRCIWPGERLASLGYPVTVAPPGHSRRLAAAVSVDPRGVQHVSSVVDPKAEVAVFQRPLSRLFVEAMRHLKGGGVKIVVELDDDFRATSPRNTAFRAVHPRYSPEANWQHLDRALDLADVLVASTPSIARRYGHTRKHLHTVVVRNRVPDWYLTQEPVVDPHAHPRPPVIGWTGTTATHPDDLPVVRGSVAEVVRATGAGFRVVGSTDGVARALGISDRIVSGGWAPARDYAKALAGAMDVGICPLEPSTFNDGKSWLKPLEMAALGIPAVASPVAEYRELAFLGLVTLAEKPAEWRRAMLAWLTDLDAAREEGARRRNRIADPELGLTIGSTATEWWDAWTSAC